MKKYSVQDLLRTIAIEQIPPKSEILLAADEEGNAFHHFKGYSFGYVPPQGLENFDGMLYQYKLEDNWVPVLILWP